MQYKVKVTVIDKKLYPDLQQQYCANPQSGSCPCYHIGDEFIFERYGDADDFWHMGFNTLKETTHSIEQTAGGTKFPHCSEAWDAISRYIYTGLQGGSIMRHWMNDERIMITCCSDGTRPVIFKIERMDYKVAYVNGLKNNHDYQIIKETLLNIPEVTDVIWNQHKNNNYLEIYLDQDISDDIIKEHLQSCGTYQVNQID